MQATEEGNLLLEIYTAWVKLNNPDFKDSTCPTHTTSLILREAKGCKLGTNAQIIFFFLSPYFPTFNLLLNHFSGNPQLSELISTTCQFRFLQCFSLLQKRNLLNYNRPSFKPLMLCSTGQFKCLAFISHYVQLKIMVKHGQRNVALKG